MGLFRLPIWIHGNRMGIGWESEESRINYALLQFFPTTRLIV